jgi:hypothetical protein
MKKGFRRLGLWHDSMLGPDSGFLLVSEGLDEFQLFNRLCKYGLNLKARGLRQPYALVGALGPPWEDDKVPKQSVANYVALLNLIAECEFGNELLPPRALIASIREWGIPDGKIETVPPTFFKVLWIACTQAEYHEPRSNLAIERFIKRKLLPMIHWYFNQGQNSQNANSIARSWFSFEWHYKKWFDEAANRKEDLEPAPYQWDALLGSQEIGDFRFVALASAKALEVEGRLMEHCVADYIGRCHKGSVRIFSVRSRDSGKRLASLSLKIDEMNDWVLDELFGPGNSEVPENLEQAAKAFSAAVQHVSCLVKMKETINYE